MKSITSKLAAAWVLGAASIAFSFTAAAQPSLSDKPIRMVVPLAAGSTVDAARALRPSRG